MILGIWDGHDAGACLIEGGSIVFAVNEERFTRRKLEIGFPANSIEHCLEFSGNDAGGIEAVSVSTSDISKTMGRMFPFTVERHYLFRRRLRGLPFPGLHKKFKLWVTAFGPNGLTEFLSKKLIRAGLKKFGLHQKPLYITDHHRAHACCASFCSPFDAATVITMDGLGDGASGTVSKFENGKLEEISRISSRDSLGVFFEQVTFLLGMRELEDEGKVMALADYSLPVPPEKNPLMNLFEVDGLKIKARLSSLKMFGYLKEILWKTPFEQFARMAQDTLQEKGALLASNAVKATGIPNICMAGGIFANVKLNMLIRKLPDIKGWFVFPQMGDGGLALGAAASVNYNLHGISRIPMPGVFTGLQYNDDEIEAALKKSGLKFNREPDISLAAARLIADGKIVLWFRGKSEYGPRALGHRSILAPPYSLEIKDLLNLKLKRRSWFQPFCPSILEEDAPSIFEDYDGSQSPFMTMAYMMKPEYRDKLPAVISIDGSCRPQVVGPDDDTAFRTLLENVKKFTGTGCILNTSFNRHGEPLVETPEDAVKTMTGCNFPYMAIGDFMLYGEGAG
ncbi:MAG: hypothetical protein M1269_08545 [Chloroflexi bacterium]|nr:hypothetical protein [Chloroflexota bacterium]